MVVTTAVQSYYYGMPGKRKNSAGLASGARLTDIRVRAAYRALCWSTSMMVDGEPGISAASFGRSNAEQKALRIQNCSNWQSSPVSSCRPPTARVGTSRHNERQPGYRLGNFVLHWPASLAIDSSPRRGSLTYAQQRDEAGKHGLIPNLWGPPPSGEYWHLVPVPTWPASATIAICGRGLAGSQGSPDAVAAVQSGLARLGLDAGAADGQFGPKTERAVAAFQLQHGLTFGDPRLGIVSGDWTTAEQAKMVGLLGKGSRVESAPVEASAPSFNLDLGTVEFGTVRQNDDGPLVADIASGLVVAGYLPPAALANWSGRFDGVVWQAADEFKNDKGIRSRAFNAQAWRALAKARIEMTRTEEPEEPATAGRQR